MKRAIVTTILCSAVLLWGCDKMRTPKIMDIDVATDETGGIISHENTFNAIIPLEITPGVTLTNNDVSVVFAQSEKPVPLFVAVKTVTKDSERDNVWNISTDFELEKGLYKIKVIVDKKGYLPSHSRDIELEVREWPRIRAKGHAVFHVKSPYNNYYEKLDPVTINIDKELTWAGYPAGSTVKCSISVISTGSTGSDRKYNDIKVDTDRLSDKREITVHPVIMSRAMSEFFYVVLELINDNNKRYIYVSADIWDRPWNYDPPTSW